MNVLVELRLATYLSIRISDGMLWYTKVVTLSSDKYYFYKKVKEKFWKIKRLD